MCMRIFAKINIFPNLLLKMLSVSHPQKSANGGTEKIQKSILSQQIIIIISSSANANIPKAA